MSGALLLRSLIQTVGCDGLANPDLRCGCSIDDLMPCANSDLTRCYLAKTVGHNPGDGHPGFITCSPTRELITIKQEEPIP